MLHRITTLHKKASEFVPSVSEQLQKYRQLIGESAQRPMPGVSCTVQWQHPNTKDYFRNLMKEWRKDNARTALAETRT